MDSLAGSPRQSSRIGRPAMILGSVAIPGRPEHVSATRAFIAQILTGIPGVDADAATLLTSELVTNAIQHTDSGTPDGTVTVVIIGIPTGLLVEVVDEGSAGTPIVKPEEPDATGGHGLFLVQQLAAQWGYLRDQTGTTVWFHLPAALEGRAAGKVRPVSYLLAASATATTAAQIRATSSSLARYGGIV
jgi:anti-sigma regulatory factor (Ser/Thr protein kinase)